MKSLNRSIVTLLHSGEVPVDFINKYKSTVPESENSVDVIKDYWIRKLLNITGGDDTIISTCMYLRDCSNGDLFVATFKDDVVKIILTELDKGNNLI